jgi:hypothetical protein
MRTLVIRHQAELADSCHEFFTFIVVLFLFLLLLLYNRQSLLLVPYLFVSSLTFTSVFSRVSFLSVLITPITEICSPKTNEYRRHRNNSQRRRRDSRNAKSQTSISLERSQKCVFCFARASVSFIKHILRVLLKYFRNK